jgi:hypothetical protein
LLKLSKRQDKLNLTEIKALLDALAQVTAPEKNFEKYTEKTLLFRE